jgi:DNA-directed RNA polymerase specialized sigma24 family protein
METYVRAVPVDAGPSEEPTMGLASRDVGGDPAEEVARIAAARRGRLLRVHRRRLRWEDLEDCYSQATLELVTRSRRTPFVSYQHILNSLEQKFLSRIEDRRRAIGGRSAIETAMARAVPVDSPDHGASELEDRGAAVEHQVIARIELRRLREVIADLSRDQQLVLASQVYVDMGAGEFCARHGWSVEKYRKVAQRARGKLRVLIEEYERGERCQRLEPDLLAMCAGVAQDEALARARAHVGNCPTCARMVGDLDRAARSVAALLPMPGPVVFGAGGVAVKLTAAWTAVRRAATIVRHPLAETGVSSGTGVAGGSLASVGALKVGVAAVCVAGAAGGYAVCARLGVLPAIGIGLGHQVAHQAVVHHRRPARARLRGAAPPSASQARSPSVVVRAAGRDGLDVLPARVSAIAQIRREFGSPSVRTASATSIGGGGATSSTSGGGPSVSPVVSKAQTSQTQGEFGFEK